MTPQLRGTIIKTPDSNPGLLFVDGQQKPFTLEGIWKSPVAPAVNMPVDVEFDGAGLIVSLIAVDPQQAAREKLSQFGGVAQERGKEAAVLARQGVGALAARMGKVALGATVILWLAWFFMPVVTIEQYADSRAFTFWEFLALGLSNANAPLQFVLLSHGLLSILGLTAIAAPFAAPFVRHGRAKLLYALPLLYLLLAGVSVVYDGAHAISEATAEAKGSVTYDAGNPAYNRQQQIDLQGVEDRLEEALLKRFSIGYGAFVIVIASVVLAMQALTHPGYGNTRSVVRRPASGFVAAESGFCTKCGKPLSAGEDYCTGCGAQRTSAAGS
jgi:hypothetical protein